MPDPPPTALEFVAYCNVKTEDLEWKYLEGDGDFRSEEVKRLRDEADIIVTNPPFSLFREFLAWILEGRDLAAKNAKVAKKKNGEGLGVSSQELGEKMFLIIGNMNAITYKEVFPLIKDNKMWLGESIHSGDREFGVPKEYPLNAAGWRIDEDGNHYIRVKGVRWFMNLEHGCTERFMQGYGEFLTFEYYAYTLIYVFSLRASKKINAIDYIKAFGSA